MLLCLLLAPATAFFRPQNGGAVAWNSSPLQKDNVFDSHVQARHVKSSTKSAKSSKESSKSRRTKSSKAGSIGSSSSGSNSAGSGTFDDLATVLTGVLEKDSMIINEF